MADIKLFGSELPEYQEPGGWKGNFGELPDDLREVGEPSGPDPGGLPGPQPFAEPGPTPPAEHDGYATTGGADRQYVEPVPPMAATRFVGVNFLPRYNFESFRSQRFEQIGGALLLPTSGTVFTPLASFTVPSAFAGVLTGITQWIGDASSYLKNDGSPDDITWRITVNDALVFNYGSLRFTISTATQEAKMFVVLNENAVVTISASNTITTGSFGARNIPVRGSISGYQFPIDEVDDIFRNR